MLSCQLDGRLGLAANSDKSIIKWSISSAALSRLFRLLLCMDEVGKSWASAGTALRFGIMVSVLLPMSFNCALSTQLVVGCTCRLTVINSGCSTSHDFVTRFMPLRCLTARGVLAAGLLLFSLLLFQLFGDSTTTSSANRSDRLCARMSSKGLGSMYRRSSSSSSSSLRLVKSTTPPPPDGRAASSRIS